MGEQEKSGRPAESKCICFQWFNYSKLPNDTVWRWFFNWCAATLGLASFRGLGTIDADSADPVWYLFEMRKQIPESVLRQVYLNIPTLAAFT